MSPKLDPIEAALHGPDPMLEVIEGRPKPVDVRAMMIERTAAVCCVDREALAIQPRQMSDYLAEVTEVMAYRQKLNDAEREAFEGEVVVRVGARAVNEFFGYTKSLSAMKKAVLKNRTAEEAQAQLKQATSREFQQIRQNQRETRELRSRKKVKARGWGVAVTRPCEEEGKFRTDVVEVGRG